MDILSILALLWRHKVVVAITTVLAVTILIVTVVVAPATYRASSAIILLYPPPIPEPEPGENGTSLSQENPYIQLNDLTVVVDIVHRIMDSKPTRDELAAAGLVGDYEVAANIDFYRGPIIDVAAEAPSEREAVESTQLVMRQVGITLERLQDAQGTDPAYQIRTDVVVPATQATPVLSSLLRRLIAVSGASVIMILGSAILAETITNVRKKRSAAQATDSQRGGASTNGTPSQGAASPPGVPVQTQQPGPDSTGELPAYQPAASDPSSN